ncbi:hypothetical protein [Dinghuibacter sp.]|uniref:hypothetical protein n=1 Tax=Dinghuibacter sp. TaxID=2024697 RepID=UPI002D8080FB|nr:hypothetical protein [Dinghuibacter sp.]
MQDNLRRILMALTGGLYLVLVGYTLARHELWGDEIHSWNIVKASSSLGALFHNMRYEGHPPVWYLILYAVSRFTHRPEAMQPVQFVLASAFIFLLLYRSPLPLWAKLLAPFGYFLLYEYGAFSRNYAVGVLLAFSVCLMRSRDWRYYVLLVLLSNTHLLGLLLAFSFLVVERRWVGFLFLLPAVYFILPPTDSQMNTGFWLGHWDVHRVLEVLQAPVRAFFPLPAWGEEHWWNTEFVTGWSAVLVGLACVALAWLALRRRWLFGVNLLTTLCAGLVFPLTSARYTGFLWIGFIAACWVGGVRRRWALLLLMALQLPGGVFAVWQDWNRPFSRASAAPSLVGEVPAGDRVVCDYWALNPLAAYTDSAFFCIDLGESRRFLRWDGDFAARLRRPDRYVAGARPLGRPLYLVSTLAPAELQRVAGPDFRVRLVDFRDGAIEKGSDLYLYEVL